MGKESDKRYSDQMNQDSRNYKLGFLYWNKYDKRIIVPKRTREFGWTLNFANPATYIILVIFVLVVFLAGRFF